MILFIYLLFYNKAFYFVIRKKQIFYSLYFYYYKIIFYFTIRKKENGGEIF